MSEKKPLITNVQPPSELPSFIAQQSSSSKEQNSENKDKSEIATEKFSPAIPAEKNFVSAPPHESDDEDLDDIPSIQNLADALSPITDGVKNSILFGWVKDTMKSGVQLTKESIDKVVTTLDPQMSQIICKCSRTVILQFQRLSFRFWWKY